MNNLLDDFIRYLEVERNVSRYTVRNYRNDLQGSYLRGAGKGFFQFLKLNGTVDLSQVDRHTMRDYVAWLMEQGVVKPSIARKLSAIRSFYRYLVRESKLAKNPVEDVTSPKLDKRLPDFLTIEEMGQLLRAPDANTPEGQRDRAIVELLYASGLRVSELVSLDLGQVNLDAREIRVRGKGNKERLVLMGIPAAQALSAYIREGRAAQLSDRKTGAVFLSHTGERLIARRVQKLLEGYARKAGIEKRVHPHMLRHTFATHMLDGGADLRVVQELAGHARLTSTQIYTNVTKTQIKKVYLSAHPMARGKNDQQPGAETPPEDGGSGI